MIVIVVFVLFQGGLIGGELEQMFGPASGVVGAGIDTVEGGYNTVVDSLEDNRQFARMQCMWELGGPVGAAFVPATKLSQCVRKRMGAGNRTNATSAQVTQPVEVRVGDIEVAPFSDHVTVRAPVTNTLVYDTRGVPIDEIPARNVDVTVAWIYGGETFRKKKVSLGEVPNGATKLAGDNEDLSFDWVPV
ncbi:MAG: hypothetical protein SVQ76_01535, partial [Candidatus Nanohaloarchaea archaeon]|nr:hypothetical protein [Candidatus Nanohaloarchaea archaeon]